MNNTSIRLPKNKITRSPSSPSPPWQAEKLKYAENATDVPNSLATMASREELISFNFPSPSRLLGPLFGAPVVDLTATLSFTLAFSLEMAVVVAVLAVGGVGATSMASALESMAAAFSIGRRQGFL
jgi:hypothetical protein